MKNLLSKLSLFKAVCLPLKVHCKEMLKQSFPKLVNFESNQPFYMGTQLKVIQNWRRYSMKDNLF